MCFDGGPVDTSPRDQSISVIAIASDAPRDATSLEKLRILGNIVPHRRKGQNRWVYKAGRFNAIALPPQTTNQGPLTRGPSTCQPSHCHMAPPGQGMDSRGACHESALPCATWAPRGLARLCHMALHAALHPCGSRVPHQLCAPRQPRGLAEINPSFAF